MDVNEFLYCVECLTSLFYIICHLDLSLVLFRFPRGGTEALRPEVIAHSAEGVLEGIEQRFDLSAMALQLHSDHWINMQIRGYKYYSAS